MNFTKAWAVQAPSGKWSAAGLVPATCLTIRPLTMADAMAGRKIKIDGKWMGWRGRYFDTAEECKAAIEAGGVECGGISEWK